MFSEVLKDVICGGIVVWMFGVTVYYTVQIFKIPSGPKRRKLTEEISDIINNPDKYIKGGDDDYDPADLWKD